MSDKLVPLSTIAEIVGGFAFKSQDFTDIGYPVVKIAEIEPAHVNLDACQRISPEKVKGLEKFRLRDRDILMAMTGATIGKVGRIRSDEPAYLNQRVAKISAKAGRKFDDFVYAVVSQKGFDINVLNNAAGSAQSNVSADGIGRILVPDFSPGEQLQIGQVIAALDDKIELNRRMNETLEALAQSLFKSWFLDAMLDGLPKGWRIGPILSHAKLLSGGTPKTERQEYWNGDIPWASAKDVSQCGQSFLVTTERTITQKGLEESATQMIPVLCTVVVARGATTGRMVIFGREMAMNQTCYALASTTGTPFALYCRLRHEMDDLVHTAHGSVFDTITTSTFAGSRVVLPLKETLEEFEKIVSPIFHRILANTEESRTLVALRDALLPKLLSREVRVSD